MTLLHMYHIHYYNVAVVTRMLSLSVESFFSLVSSSQHLFALPTNTATEYSIKNALSKWADYSMSERRSGLRAHTHTHSCW